MEAEISKHTAQFLPSDKPGVYLGTANSTVFGDGPITWARLELTSTDGTAFANLVFFQSKFPR